MPKPDYIATTREDAIAIWKREWWTPEGYGCAFNTDDRTANDQTFLDWVDGEVKSGALPQRAMDWSLTYKDGGR